MSSFAAPSRFYRARVAARIGRRIGGSNATNELGSATVGVVLGGRESASEPDRVRKTGAVMSRGRQGCSVATLRGAYGLQFQGTRACVRLSPRASSRSWASPSARTTAQGSSHISRTCRARSSASRRTWRVGHVSGERGLYRKSLRAVRAYCPACHRSVRDYR